MPSIARPSQRTFISSRIRSIVSVCLLLFLLTALLKVRWTDAEGLAQETATTLEFGHALERSLNAGESHPFNIMLAADQYVEVTVEQLGINVKIEASDPNGHAIAHINRDKTKKGAESLTFIAEVSGAYRLQVSAAEKSIPPGKYRVEMVTVRPPSSVERELERARRFSETSLDLREQGKYDEALPPAEQALAIREKVLGPDDRAVADSLHAIALLYDDKGDYVKAEPLNLRALAIREKLLGPDHPDVGLSLFNLAWIYQSRQDYAKAEATYQRLLRIGEQAYGLDHPEVATILNDFALVYNKQGEYQKAIDIEERVLTIRQKTLGPEDKGVAKSLNNLGLDYFQLGDYEKAELLLQQAVRVWEKALGPDHPEVSIALNNLALIYLNKGDYEQAESIQRRVLAITEKSLGPNHLGVGHALNNLAHTYQALGDYEQAEPLFRRALAVREKAMGPGHSEVGEGLNNLGRILQLRNPDDPQVEALFLKSLAILEKTLGPDHHKVAAPIGNLAAFYERREDYARAEPLYQHALSILEKALGPNHPDVAAMLNKIAHFYAAKGDGQQALNFLSRANAAREWSIQHSLSLGSERQKLSFLSRFAEDTDTALSWHAQLNPKDQAALELAFTTLLQRKGRALDAMSNNFALLRSRATPEDQALLKRLSNAQTKLAAFSFRKPDKDTAAYHANLKKLEFETENLEAEVSSRSVEFRSQSRPISLGAIQSLLPSGTTLIEYALYTPVDPKRKAHATARYSAYLLPASGKANWVDLGEATPIDRAIELWRKALRDPERADVSQLSRTVDEKVMRPVRTVLGPTMKLLVSPDGPLNLIPFAALTDEHGKYLAETSTITYLTSGRDLLRLQVARPTRSGPVIVADPAFGEPALIASNAVRDPRRDAPPQVDYAQIFFGPLPGVGEEVRALKQLLPTAMFLTRDQATKEALKRLSGPSILHIATHGFFLEDVSPPETNARRESATPRMTRVGKWVANVDNPLLRSGLALAGANQGANGSADGVLTALEAAGLDLWGTKLVVLSACDTGVGEVKNDDGVYGLRRALVLAGAESQLMSLWPAADRSTRELMVGYYKALTRGAGRGEALREVQLQMLHSKTHNHPYYWASFIQTGEWANLNGKR